MFELKGKYGKAIIYTTQIDQEALKIIQQYLNHPISKNQNIRIMPDVHAGKGVVIGFTSTLHKDWIIPNVVGVDIGCGILAYNIGKEIPSLEEIDNFIKEKIPAGMNVYDKPNIPSYIDNTIINEIRKVSKETQQDEDYVLCSLGTLGGGNHFIEIAKDNDNYYWLVIHTGSRNFGLKVAKYHQNIAKNICKKQLLQEKIVQLKNQYSGELLNQKIQEVKCELKIPNDMTFLYGEYTKKYFEHMYIAQEYAKLNRKLIAHIITNYFKLPVLEKIESVHNYIDFEDNIIRKGAIRAHKNEKVIIPFNMVYGSIIGIGKGNKEWNNSAPHGAGRILSRSKAKETININDFKKILEEHNVYSTTANEHTKDEAPMVYKDPENIVPILKETIHIEKTIKPIYNFKG